MLPLEPALALGLHLNRTLRHRTGIPGQLQIFGLVIKWRNCRIFLRVVVIFTIPIVKNGVVPARVALVMPPLLGTGSGGWCRYPHGNTLWADLAELIAASLTAPAAGPPAGEMTRGVGPASTEHGVRKPRV